MVETTTARTTLEQMGGPMGFVYSTIPVIVFVTANAFLPLGVTIGVSVAVGLALTGFRLLWASLAGFVVTFGSVLARRPVTGVVWNLLHGGQHAWRANRTVLRAHDIATLAAAVVLGSRFAVQQWLYVADTTGGLGVARIAMGTPLTVLAALVVVWAFRRSTKHLLTPA